MHATIASWRGANGEMSDKRTHMSIVGLNTHEEVKKAQASFERVFISGNPFDEPFADLVQARVILCQTSAEVLGCEQYEALRSAAKMIGESRAIITMVEQWSTLGFSGAGSLSLDLDWTSYDEYQNPSEEIEPPRGPAYVMVENALYSDKGTWGVMCTHETFGVIGGTIEFLDAFLENYRPKDVDYRNFIDMWAENAKTWEYAVEKWLPKLVKHIYRDCPPFPVPLELGGCRATEGKASTERGPRPVKKI